MQNTLFQAPSYIIFKFFKTTLKLHFHQSQSQTWLSLVSVLVSVFLVWNLVFSSSYCFSGFCVCTSHSLKHWRHNATIILNSLSTVLSSRFTKAVNDNTGFPLFLFQLFAFGFLGLLLYSFCTQSSTLCLLVLFSTSRLLNFCSSSLIFDAVSAFLSQTVLHLLSHILFTKVCLTFDNPCRKTLQSVSRLITLASSASRSVLSAFF